MSIARSLHITFTAATALLLLCACSSSDAPSPQTTAMADAYEVCDMVQLAKTAGEFEPFAARLDGVAQQAATDDPRWKALAADVGDLDRAYVSYQSRLDDDFAQVVSDCTALPTP